MRLPTLVFGAMLVAGLLSGCGSAQQAEVVNHGDQFYGRDGVVTLSSAPGATVEDGTYQSAVTLPVDVQNLTTPATAPTAETKPVAVTPAATAANTSWQWPVNGTVTGIFGQNIGGIKNEGIMIAAPEGTPIRAAQAGEVIYVGNDVKIYGNVVILRHANGDMTSYAHAKNIVVSKGSKVDSGSTLGYVGHTGNVKTPVLHFAMREKGASVDPLKKLPHQLAAN